MTAGYRVFISYRRAGQPEVAAWLHERLAGELSADEVFLDQEELEEGRPFPPEIALAIESAPAFIALIDANWNPILADGKRRLDNPDDYVRRELELALDKAAADERRLILPVLLRGAIMPPADTLPDSLVPLRQYGAAFIQEGIGYQKGIERVIDTVLRRLDEVDETPEEERWILKRIASELQQMQREQVARMGSELRRVFSLPAPPPKTIRAVARTIYRIGPASLECLLALGEPGKRIGKLIKLLATHWIKPGVARSLRDGLQNDEVRQPIAIACNYPDFTANESLLKASHLPWGWPSVVVKPADPALEIVQQVHEKLAHEFNEQLAEKRSARLSAASGSNDDRLNQEREDICEVLQERRARSGRDLPLVLFADHRMCLDENVFAALYHAFPPLRILVPTPAADELKAKNNTIIVLRPSDTATAEKSAYEAFQDARDLLQHVED